MSEFRKDPLRGSWVITQNQSVRQPHEFILKREQPSLAVCPFCPGEEAKTPSEVFAVRPQGGEKNGPGWQLRVVPNKFPALRIEGELNQRINGLYRSMQGVGAHEVIIETPDHQSSMAHLEISELTEVLKAYRGRLLDLRQDRRFRYLLIFKNHGIEAGAPLLHSHSQLMAVPITPPVVSNELSRCKKHFIETCRCLVCEMLAQELEAEERVVYNDGRFVVVAPYASCFPFELSLFPVKHNHDFILQSDEQLMDCAKALQNMLRRLFCLLDDPPFNFILHTSPPTEAQPQKHGYWETLAQDYHWHIELVPRLTRIAGFEWGSGFFVNPLSPEAAASFLKKTDPELRFSQQMK